MDLKTSLPQNAPADIVYSLPANFTREGDKMDGHFCVTKEKIYIYNGSEITLEYSIDDFSEFECKQQIGTSMAQGTLKSGETICFCGFSQDQFLRYAELMKLLDHCLRTGELMEITDTEEPVCPKCGLPLEGAKECIYCTGKGKTMVKLIKRIAPYKKYFAIAVICTILSELIWVLAPYLDRVIIDKYVTPKNTHWAGLAGVIITIVTLLLLAGVFEFFNMKNSFKVALNLGLTLGRRYLKSHSSFL